MESWVTIYLIGCMVVLLLLSTVVTVDINVEDRDSDFMVTAVKIGAILLSWYTLIVLAIISIGNILNSGVDE